MKKVHWLLTVGVLGCVGGALLCLAEGPKADKKKILFYSQSFGFRHSVVARPLTGELSHAEKIFKEVATKAGYEVFLSQDHNDLKGDQFKKYDAIVFYTSGNPLINRENLMKWLKDGGALIGIHAATDSFRMKDDYTEGFPEYIQAIGGSFRGHKSQRAATLKIEVTDHPATTMLAQSWKLKDEYYLFADCSRDNVRMLISVDTEKTSADDLKAMGMKPDGDYGIAWTNTVDKGRVFYTALGHREDVWTNELFQKHLLGGVAWTLGKDK